MLYLIYSCFLLLICVSNFVGWFKDLIFMVADLISILPHVGLSSSVKDLVRLSSVGFGLLGFCFFFPIG